MEMASAFFADEATAVACLADAETCSKFERAGWGAGRVHADDAAASDVQRTFDAVRADPGVGVLLVAARVAEALRSRDRKRADAALGAMAPVVVIELPPADAASRVSCTLYDPRPYEKWPPPPPLPTRANHPPKKGRAHGENLGTYVDISQEVETADEATARRRIEALVMALFRLVALEEAQLAKAAWTGEDEDAGTVVFKLEVFNRVTQEVAELVGSAAQGGRYFVRALNKERTRMIDVARLFPFLAGLLLTLLDRCQRHHDVESILNAMMLSQTFYRSRAGDREYLKAAIQAHPVWEDREFWRNALNWLVAKQAAQPGSWSGTAATDGTADTTTDDDDSLLKGFSCFDWALPSLLASSSPDAPQDGATLALWSQLGGVVHAMLEFGVQPEAVHRFVDDVATDHGLSDDQRVVIDDHIRAHSPSETTQAAFEESHIREDHYRTWT